MKKYKPKIGDRIKVRDDSLSTWSGQAGKIISVNNGQTTCVVKLDVSETTWMFWFDQVEKA